MLCVLHVRVHWPWYMHLRKLIGFLIRPLWCIMWLECIIIDLYIVINACQCTYGIGAWLVLVQIN